MKISSNEQTQQTILQGVIKENDKSNDYKKNIYSKHNTQKKVINRYDIKYDFVLNYSQNDSQKFETIN